MIRRADLKDFDRVMALLENFANCSPLPDHHNPKYNYRGVEHFLANVSRQGVILVGEADGAIQGMLIAQVLSDSWLPEVRVLKELAWWVEPSHRNSSLGYRLLKEYVKFGKALKEKNIISAFTLTTLEDSPIRDLERFGWRPIEKNYVYGE